MPNITDTVTTPDGSAPVRLFTPEGQGPWPGVVMIPDAGGFRQTFFDMAATLADSGYAVLLPDVYYRQGDWAPFDMKTAFSDDDERKRLMSFVGSITPDRVGRPTRRRTSTTWPLGPRSAAPSSASPATAWAGARR